MIFTTKAEYGVRLLVELGRQDPGTPVSLKAIAEAEGLPLAYLERIVALLKKAAETFLGTAEMGVAEWTTAALYQIGFTYESFSKALLGSPPPDKLSDQEKEVYKQSIDEFVVPIEERSLEAYESGWQKAIELGIFNSWTAKMREALGRLNSELYPPLKETGFKLRSRGNSALPALIDGTRRAPTGGSEKFLISSGADKNAAAKGQKLDKPAPSDKAEPATKAGKK